MESKKVIQVLSKVAQVVSKIIFICCLVGIGGCVLGIICLLSGIDSVQVGDVTLKSIIENEAGMNVNSLYAIMAVGIVLCVGESVLARFADHYFTNELKDDTPFTFKGAKELIRLGVLALAIPIGTNIIAEIVYEIMKASLSDVVKYEIDGISLGAGFTLLLLGFVCRYACELLDDKQKANNVDKHQE